MGVFGDYALKYLESGYLPLPLEGKACYLPGWTDEDVARDVDKIIDFHLKDNIGVLLGPGSGIVAFDFDLYSDGFETLSTADTLALLFEYLPETEVWKKGKKGATLFYRYQKGIENDNLAGVFDFLVTGKQTAVPPSIYIDKEGIHRPEYDYQWGPVSLLDVKPLDLPIITKQHIAKFKEAYRRYEKKTEVGPNGDLKTPGRNNRLYRMCCGAIAKNKPLDIIVQELFQYDRDFHKPSYFANAYRNRKTPLERAENFVNVTLRNLQRRGKEKDYGKVVQMIEVVNYEIPEVEKDLELPFPNQWKIKTLIEEFARVNKREDNVYALPSAFLLASTIIGPYWHMNGIYPNLDAIVGGPTGGGKESGADTIADILRHYGYADRIGHEIVSDIAFISRLEDWKYRIRLDVIDECDVYLKEALLKKQGSFARLGKYILQHSTWPGKHFNGTFGKTGGVSGACFSPYICIYGATTTENVAEVLKLNGFSTGFFSRFMWIFGKELQPLDISKGDLDWDLLDYIIKPMIPMQLPIPFKKKTDFKPVEFNMDELIFYTKESDKLAREARGERQNILVRQHVLMSKIALIIACVENPQSPVVTSDMLAYGYDFANKHTEILLKFYHDNSGNLADELCKAIKKQRNGISRRDLYNNWRQKISLKVFDDLINQLIKENLIAEIYLEAGQKRKKCYISTHF